jgi:CheY-like chemotaxis protein
MACIVIAGDDAEAAAFIGYSLEMAGHEVHTAHSGANVLGLVRRERPELVVLDHGPPGTTVLEVVTALRADPGTAPVLILLISDGDPGPEAAIVDRLVRKPLRPRQLAALTAGLVGAPVVPAQRTPPSG